MMIYASMCRRKASMVLMPDSINFDQYCFHNETLKFDVYTILSML